MFEQLAQKLDRVINRTPRERALFYNISESDRGQCNALINSLREAANGHLWRSPEEFEGALLLDPQLDLSFILAAKCLLVDWIITNKDVRPTPIDPRKREGLSQEEIEAREGMSLESLIGTIRGVDVPTYCKEVILDRGVDAEDMIVDKGALFEVFNVRGGMINLNAREEDPTTYVESPHQGDPTTEVLVRLEGGHYNLLRSETSVRARRALEGETF